MIKRLFTIASILTSLFVGSTVVAQPRVFLIGDSTTDSWGPNKYPCMGWGGVFQYFFDKEKVIVDNRAVGGTTSKSFYEKHWPSVIPDISNGDFLFISFGANDSNIYNGIFTTTDEFIEYMRIFCDAAREKGATPVLLSTINRNWYRDNVLKRSYVDHPQAMKNASEILDTPFFDLYTFGFNLSMEVGREYNTYYRYNSYFPGEYEAFYEGKYDEVHIQETGATDFCRFIVEEIEKSSDERLKLLADATKPRYNVTFDADNDSMYTSISRSATFPEGINVTLKSYGVDSTKKCHWINGNDEIISENNIFVYVMKDHDEHFTAIYSQSSVKQIPLDNFRVLSNRIIFSDDLIHTVRIYSLSGYEMTSVSTQSNYEFNLPSGIYVLTIDGEKSTKIMIK